MARKPKYNEATKVVSFKVPESKEQDVRKLVGDYLVKLHKEITTVYEEVKSCGCYLDGTILKRSKESRCKLTKAEHKF